MLQLATVGSYISTSQLQSYIQDATSGINVFIAGAPPTVTEGNSYIVKGQVQQFSGNTEISPSLNADVIDNGVSTIPNYQVVTLTDLNANLENYEGKYIAVQSLTRFSGTWPTTAVNTTLVFHDEGANSLNVTLIASTDMHSNSEPTWPGDIKGIFVQTAVAPTYALEPRRFADDFGAKNSMPVELSSFTSNMNGRNVQLNWETKTEIGFNKFEIDRALVSTKDASVTWISIGSVQASGSSNSPKKYSFTEKDLQAGKYQYRLKMIDNDGSYKYSNVVETEITLPKNFELSQNYPNPFNPSTRINYSLPFDSRVTLEVYNITGERIGQIVNKEQSAGYYTVNFSSSTLNRSISSGVYIYKINAVDKSTGNVFTSIKKMMLLK